jgi:hypothetical protein
VPKTQSKFEQFQKTNSYNELVRDRKLDEEGIWQVYGEDAKDLGGSYQPPFLGLFSGKLIDVICYAVELPRFWEWGPGGAIKKLGEPIPITAESVRERTNDLEQIEQLTMKLEALKKKNGIR